VPELSHATTASRSALLEIKDELRLVNDGYEFLDEKRILLAAEVLRQRDEWRERQKVFMERWRVARDALVAAAADQGLQGLEVAPPTALPDARIEVRTRPYVGQVLIEAGFVPGEPEESRAALRPTPQLAACREAFAAACGPWRTSCCRKSTSTSPPWKSISSSSSRRKSSGCGRFGRVGSDRAYCGGQGQSDLRSRS
jgi:hypothetical protein